MTLSGFQSLRALRVGVCRIACVLISLLFVAPFAAAQGLQPGGAANMGSVALGSSSLNYTFIFTATSPTTIQSVTYFSEGKHIGDFTQTSGATQNCTGTIQTGHSCTINVTFSPLSVGFRRGAVVLTDNTGITVFTQYLYGVGLGPQISFAPVSASVVSSLSGVTPTAFQPSSVVYDGLGNLYFFDYLSGRLFFLDTTGHLILRGTFLGDEHSSLAVNGMGRTVYLTLPSGIEVVSANGTSTALPTPGVTITSPAGIAIDGGGTVYVADSQNNRIVQIAADGSSASYVPTPGITLSSPFGLAIDYNNLYIADSNNGRIVTISVANGTASAMTSMGALNQPYGIAVDASGTVIVANRGGGNLVQVSPAGTVTPVVPDAGVTIASAPMGVSVAMSGDYVSADANLGLVTVTRSSNAQMIFPTPTKVGAVDGTDGYETMTVQNTGNLVIDLGSTTPTISNADFYLGTTNSCPINSTTATPLAVAVSCTYTFGFKPSVVGADSSVVSIHGTAETTGALITNIDTLNGTGISAVDSFSVVAAPNSTTPGVPVGFTVTALQGTNTLTTFAGTVTFTMTDATGLFLGGTSYTFTAADAGTHTFPATLGAEFNKTGTYTITASFGTITGTSNAVTVLYGTTTALTSSANPTAVGGQTTLAATVSGVGTSNVPTGTVTFYNGSTVIGSCVPVAGTCSITPSLPVGSGEVLKAVYGGSTTFASSTSNTISQTVPGYTATFVLTSSVNPSAVNQQVTFTATVTPTSGQAGAPVPTGSVQIRSNGAAICTATMTAGAGACNITYAAANSYTITATYTGDSYYAAATSNTLTQVVGTKKNPAVTMASSVNPSVVNQAVTFTATVAPPTGTATVPTGTVTFTMNATTLCANVAMTAGKATCAQTYTSTGNYPIVATYSGDAVFNNAVSSTLTQVVNAKPTPNIALASSVNPSLPNQAVTFTATMTAATGFTTVPTGSVTFTSNGTTLCANAAITAGKATCSTTYAAISTNPIVATYNGDATYLTVTSTTLTQVVSKATPKIVLTSSLNPASQGQAVTYTATMTAATGQTAVPTGSVTFTSGTTTLCATVTLSAGGVATCPQTYAASGIYPIVATYNGNTIYNTVASTTLNEVVLFTSTTTMVGVPNPVAMGTITKLTATVVATPGQTGAGQPTGSVTFYNGTTAIGSCTLAGTTCSVNTTFSTPGSASLTAVYSGSTTFKTSTSAAYTETVTTYTSSISLTSSVNPSSVNQQTILTATVTPPQGATNPPTLTGTVNFYDGTTLIGSCTVSSGLCSVAVSFTTTGNHFLTATYLGDTNYGGVSTSNYKQVVNTLFSAQVGLNATPNPVALNTAVTLTATVSALAGQAGAGTPSGTVKFYDGTTALGNCTLSAGTCSITPSFTTAGQHLITAIYSGSTSFNTVGTAQATTETVNGYNATVVLGSSVNPAAVNQQTLLTATVGIAAGQSGAPAPTGTVAIFDGTTQIGTCTLSGTTCSVPTNFTTPGTHTLTAVYSGDTEFNTKSSVGVGQVVLAYQATIALNATPTPVLINTPILLTATVAQTVALGSAPGGTVTFLSGTTPLGSAVLVNGVATLSTSFAVVNTYSITAVYNGDANYSTVTSTAASEVVEDFTFALSGPTGGSVTVMGGHAATYTFTVTPVGGAAFPSSIGFALAGFPANTVYSFSPATVAAGTGVTQVTLTVTPPVVAMMEKPVMPSSGHGREAPIALALLLFPFALRLRGKRGRRPAALMLWLLMMAGAMGLTGCLSDSATGYYGTTQQTYSLTATATSGSVSRNAGATLVRQ